MILVSPSALQTRSLIANTYRELTEQKPILRHLAESLKPGGRLASFCCKKAFFGR